MGLEVPGKWYLFKLRQSNLYLPEIIGAMSLPICCNVTSAILPGTDSSFIITHILSNFSVTGSRYFKILTLRRTLVQLAI